jgi:diguanylate cyclase (GGDEF)-like protein
LTEQSQQRAHTVRISRKKLTPHSWAREKRASIQVIGGNPADLGMHEPLDTPLVVGRGEEASFRLHDDSASRTHAWFGWDEATEQYQVRDLQSTNGTLANGELIRGPRALNHGDRVEVGETLLEFRMADQREIESREQMEAWLSTDELTGLPNKRRFDAELSQRARDPALSGAWMAILMLDLDNLKAINDQHGHHMGSQTIHEVGQIIGRQVAGKGQGTRFGGDEFTVYLVGHDLQAARRVAESIRQEVQDLLLLTDSDLPVHTTISIGLAASRGPDLDPESLCREADKALYRAKARGKNNVSE